MAPAGNCTIRGAAELHTGLEPLAHSHLQSRTCCARHHCSQQPAVQHQDWPHQLQSLGLAKLQLQSLGLAKLQLQPLGLDQLQLQPHRVSSITGISFNYNPIGSLVSRGSASATTTRTGQASSTITWTGQAPALKDYYHGWWRYPS